MPPVDPSHTPDAQEHDPTGVRALLAGLPDPGPMPEHLVRQIQTRLEVEREHLAGVAAGHPLSGSADRVVDLADERSRRRPGRTLGLLSAAATGLAVTTIAFTQLFGSGGAGDSGTMAQYPSSADSADSAAEAGDDSAADQDAAGGAEESQDLPGTDRAEDGAAGEAADGGPGVLADLAPPTVLPDLGVVVLDDYAATMARASRTTSTDDGALSLTPAQATQCWGGVAAPEAEETFAASARLESGGGAEDEVVVLLARGPGDTGRAWVLPHACTQEAGITPLEPAGRAVSSP